MNQGSPLSDFRSAVFCLAVVARIHQKPIAVDNLLREHSSVVEGRPELMDVQLIRAARDIGFKAKLKTFKSQQLNNDILPAIVRHNDGHYIVVAKKSSDGLLVQDIANQQPPKLLSADELDSICNQSFLLVTTRSKLFTPQARFGFKWFLPALGKYKKFFGDVLLASFFIQLMGLASPIFFQVAIDKVMVHKGMTTLDVLIIGFFIIITFEVLLTGMRTYLFSHTTNRVDVELGSQLYQHMIKLPISYFKARRVGDTVARVKELDTVREFLTGSSLTVVLDMFFTLVFFAVMFYYDAMLTWIVVASLPFYFFIAIAFGPSLRAKLEEKFQRSAANHSFLVESVNGVETIKSLAVEPQMRAKWDEKLAAYVAVSFKAHQINNIYGQLSSYITKITSLLILYFGAIAVTGGALTIGQFIAFNLLAQRISGPIMRFANLWQNFQQARISVERLGDVLNTPCENSGNNKMSLPKLTGKVQFEHVNFRYAPNRPHVLAEVNLSINAGEMVGIVGRSGSGKSSLAKLIQRMYLPESGRVLVDGVDLSLVDPSWLRQKIGVVLQENFLFSASVRENIALADPSAPLEKVIEVAKLAGAHEFILELPEAYDTEIGEQGSSLSGGQRQRLAIARALLTDPAILIFDEATSALDYESERIIQQNMNNICQGRTVFVIAHRLSAVKHAHRIMVLDKGRIVEQGNHQALLKHQGQYAYLHSLQFNDAVTQTPQKQQETAHASE